MNQRDGFASGFIAGTLIGGIVGGTIGALLAARRTNESTPEIEPRRNNASTTEVNPGKRRRSQLKASSEQAIELARRSLEDKIAQLNETIDEVRLTLGQVNSNQPAEENSERSSQDS